MWNYGCYGRSVAWLELFCFTDGGFLGGSLWAAVGLDCNRLSDAGISHRASCISVLSDYLDYHTINAYSLLLYHQAAADEKTCFATSCQLRKQEPFYSCWNTIQ